MKENEKTQTLRRATPADLPVLAALEAACFPPAEAAGEASLRGRLAVFPHHFWLLEVDGTVVSMVNGLVTDRADLTDDMYDAPHLHDENGAWQMIFGVDTHPDFRCRGLAGRTLDRFLGEAQVQGRRGVVLTCKERLIHYYARFGFVDEGVSGSTHGGVVWHQMRLTFPENAGKNN